MNAVAYGREVENFVLARLLKVHVKIDLRSLTKHNEGLPQHQTGSYCLCHLKIGQKKVFSENDVELNKPKRKPIQSLKGPT